MTSPVQHSRRTDATTLHAPQPQRPALIRAPSPSSTWSRYPTMQEVPYLLAPSPQPSPFASPVPSPGPWQPGVPMQPLLRRATPPILADDIDLPHSVCHRVFIWALRIVFGAAALAVPAGLVWFGLKGRKS